MKTIPPALYLIVAATALVLCGCATPPNDYHDEKEYSDMPWNTPQQWEGSRSIPGMSPGY
jgi:starvation-inducible outer membrane lipoprotein